MYWSAQLPEYTDAERAAAVFTTRSAEWHEQMAALRTGKWPLWDAGRGLVTLSLFLLAGGAFYRWDLRGLRNARTPRSRWTILILGAAIWMAQYPVLDYDLLEQLTRQYFPPWGDSIAIPLAGTAMLVSMSLPVLLLVGFLLLWAAKLPASLWVWDRSRPWHSRLWTAFYAIAGVVLTAATVAAVIEGPFLMIPLYLVGLYILASARAAALSR